VSLNRQVGANPEELRNLGRTFDKESGDVKRLINSIEAQIGHAWWVGPAKDKFQSQWDSEFKKVLNNLSDSLQQAGQAVKTTADRIEAAGS
jgi:WXG100 family type VII secretion target